MIRRILVIGSLAFAVAGGLRLASKELTERAWERRKTELLGKALFQPKERRPWEVRFESLAERMRSSLRFDEIVGSPYRPQVAWGSGEARPLDDFERVWVESLWNEISSLDPILADLRKLPLDALAWNGETQKLATLREFTNGLCARAWLALERGDDDAVAQAYADALRLTRATDDGSTMGEMLRFACDGIVLRSMRSALALEPSARVLRAVVAPLLADWAYAPERAERAIRRDLTFLADMEQHDGPWDEPAFALAQLAPVEQAIELAYGSAEALLRSRANRRESNAGPDALWMLTGTAAYLHALHAQRNVALTALAVAEYEERRGTLPAALADVLDLPAEHALDPLTGAPLPYSFADSAARIGPAEWGTRVDVHANVDDSLYVWNVR